MILPSAKGRWEGKNWLPFCKLLARLRRRYSARRLLHMTDGWLLVLLIFLAAVTYSSVGHAGASGYLAAMALAGVAPAVMKPAALTLNLLVATIGTVRFYRAGHFSWATFWPFALGSIPLAFVGGAT